MNCIAFTGFSRYSEAFPQSVLLGRFVEQSSEALFRAWYHAERPENTASGVCRTSSHPLRGQGAVAAFCNKLRLRWQLQHSLKVSQRRADYRPCDLILALRYAIMAGLRRINKTEILQYNGTFLSRLGLSYFPDQTTLRRFLRRLRPKVIRQLVALHDRLRAQLFPLPRRRSTLTFDLDSVVLTVYGRQRFARVGYNPKKRGRGSYHPLICFEAHLQEFWHGCLRPGHAVTGTGLVAFVQRCLDKVPSSLAGSRIRIRGDSGCFGKRLVELLEARGCGYAVVVREYSTIRVRARSCRFQKLGSGWEVGEFRYQALHGSGRHRFVVGRRPIPQDPVEARQLTLFKDRKYAYHVLVTNLRTHPWRVWRFYAQHATIEKDVRELLYDYPLGKIPSDDWVANVAFFQLLLFAYNLVHWFKRLCLPRSYLFATLDTIRTDFLVLPAKLVKRGSQNLLVLPQGYHHEAEFRTALQKIDKLRLPLVY